MTGDGRAPVFMLGAPRSGTSLLYRALALHSQTAWVNNYVRRVPRVPELAALNRVARRCPSSRRRVWFGASGSEAYRYGGPRSLLDRTFPQPVEGEPLFERRGVLVDDPQQPAPSADQLRLRTDLQRLTRASGGRVLISKRIGHNRRIRLLSAIFPEARFVVLSRDGRAVTRSLLKVDWWDQTDIWWHGGTPLTWQANGGDPVELAAHHWLREVEAIEEGLAGVPTERIHRVRYERLVTEPVRSLEALAGFAGLDGDPRWSADLARLRFPDRNRTPVPDPEHDRVSRIQATGLSALGYPL